MTSKNSEKTTKKVQSKLSFLDMFRTQNVPKVTEQTKTTTTEPKNPTSHSDVNNKDLLLFPDTTSDMEVDTTSKNNTETIASDSGTSATNTIDNNIKLEPLTTSWADTPIDTVKKSLEGKLDDEALSPEFLKDAQQEALKNQSKPASSDKGKSPETAEDNTNEIDFIRVPRITRFFATVEEEKIPGKNSQERMVKLENLFAASDGFLGVKHFRNRQQISIYFGNEYDLNKATQTNKDALPGATFVIVNSKEIRSAEADRTVHVRDIPLYAKSETIKNFFNKFGTIDRFSMTTVGPWQQAFIVYKQGTSLERLNTNIWTVSIMDFSCRVALMTLPREHRDERDSYSMKLTGLTRGTTHLDLKDIIQETKAMTCFIPRSRTSYKNLNYAFLSFESDEIALEAFNKIYKIKGNRLYWTAPHLQHCYICGDPSHKSQQCTNKKGPNKVKSQYDQLYNKYKPAQYRARAPPSSRDQNFRYENTNPHNNARTNQQDRKNQQRFYQNQQQSRSYADTTRPRDPKNISMHEHNTSPNNNRNTNTNRNRSAEQQQNDNHQPHQTKTPHNDEEKFSRIFHILTEVRKDISDVQKKTKSLQDELDNIRMMYNEVDVRLGNLENLMMDEEPLNPEQNEGPTHNPSLLGPLNQMQDNHDFSNNYDTPRDSKRQRYTPNDPFDHTIISQNEQMHELKEKNKAIESQLNEVLEMLRQVQGSASTQ